MSNEKKSKTTRVEDLPLNYIDRRKRLKVCDITGAIL